MNLADVQVSLDAAIQVFIAGLLIGMFVGAWEVLVDIFGGHLPRLRNLFRELDVVRTLVSINRSADRARTQMLREAGRHLRREVR